MANVTGKSQLISISSSENFGSVVSVSTRSISTTISTTYSGNMLARYNVNEVEKNFGHIDSEIFEGPLALTSFINPGPRLLRDYHKALSYLEFDSERGDFLSSNEIIDARHVKNSTTSITVLALVRIRPYPINDQLRIPIRIGTLFRVGTASADLFLNGDMVELQLRSGEGSARYRTEAQVGEWKLYSFSFGPNLNEKAYFDLKAHAPYLVSGSSLKLNTAGLVQLGYHDRLGRLDADIADMLILRKKPYQYELRQIASNLEGKFRSSSTLQSLSDTESVGRVIRTGAQTSKSLSSSTAIPTHDPGDLLGVISWHTATNPSEENFDDCDRVPTWKGIASNSDSNRDFSSHVDLELRPKYRKDYYGGGPALQYPKDGIGSTAPLGSLLANSEYTIFISGRIKGNCKIFKAGNNGLVMRIRTSPTDRSKKDLVITTNGCTSQHRTAIFKEAFDGNDAFSILLRGQTVGGEFILDAIINEVYSSSPDEVTDIDLYKTLQGGGEVVTEFGTPPEEVERTFEIQKDGPVQIGECRDSSYFQIAWYNRPLIKDPILGLDEVWFIINWFLNR